MENWDQTSYIAALRNVLTHERQAQEFRYGKKTDASNLKELKQQGVVLHPLKVLNRTFSTDETPVVHFQILYDGASNMFKPGTPVRCFQDANQINAHVVDCVDKTVVVAIHSEHFPDWIEERGVGLMLQPDEHTFDLMELALCFLEENKLENIKKILAHFPQNTDSKVLTKTIYNNENLNESQNQAVNAIMQHEGIAIVHGPPGTGKTTTIAQAIHGLVKAGKKVVVTAPSNTAVDHCARVLAKQGLKILRVGNNIKIADDIAAYMVDGYLENAAELKQIKNYQKQINELRKKSGQFKRVFDKAAREERQANYEEIKALRKEVKALRAFAIDKVKHAADVILGTPVGLFDELGFDFQADYLFIDEAGQCHDALAWLLAPIAPNWILAGDVHQLPPTYLANQNMRNPAASSILHNMQKWVSKIHFLDTQYRMTPKIAQFSNAQFYENRLRHFKAELEENAFLFYDTAGMGYEEKIIEETGSRFNEGEVDLVQKLLELPENQEVNWVLVSPYQGQVDALKTSLGTKHKISTIDSIQGQEADGIIISLVRSNDAQEIGFLQDYRRMNVALTRAQNRLIVIGDSATIGANEFYGAFLDYCEQVGAYRSGFELG
jgi:ATP-dependent RNA/DNA helicase IGHMBP2